MEHLVRFVSDEGREGHHIAASKDEAIKFAERLRNAEEASNVRLYRMQELPIQFKAYFRVELSEDEAGETAATPSAVEASSTAAEEDGEPVTAEEVTTEPAALTAVSAGMSTTSSSAAPGSAAPESGAAGLADGPAKRLFGRS